MNTLNNVVKNQIHKVIMLQWKSKENLDQPSSKITDPSELNIQNLLILDLGKLFMF